MPQLPPAGKIASGAAGGISSLAALFACGLDAGLAACADEFFEAGGVFVSDCEKHKPASMKKRMANTNLLKEFTVQKSPLKW